MTDWPHSPCHRFEREGTYMITGATLHNQKFFNTNEQLGILQTALFELALHYNWKLEAWAIFSNHYHFIAQSPKEPTTLRKFMAHMHTISAKQLNHLEKNPGRRIWYQYWDSRITFEKSYLARLNYVMNNPVRHKLVDHAEDYRWCSAKWFSQNAEASHRKTVASFKTDTVQILDNFDLE
jgi:putative transposase